MKILLLGTVFAVAGILAARSGVNAQQPERPNILFILTDDQGPWATMETAYNELQTPNIQRLRKEGAILTNSYITTPVCSPSRAGLLTSRYGSEVGITDWINPSMESSLRGVEPNLGLDSTYTTWTEILQDNGYHTGLIGKWHLGSRDKYHPTLHGYDYFMGFRGGGMVLKNPSLEKDGEVKTFEGFTTEILTREAMDFIRRNQDSTFALSLHYRAPHAPWRPLPEEDWEPYRNLHVNFPHPYYPNLDKERLRRMTREYYGSVHSVDRNVGYMLDLLESLKIAGNTIVIFTSDHGYNMGHNGIWHKGNGHWVLADPPPATKNIPKGDRPNMYDVSLKVPTIVKWPGEIEPGRTIDETISNLDWYPTLVSAAGLEVPNDVKIHGHDFTSLLRGKAIKDWDNDLYAEYSTHHQFRTHMRAYRTKEWKLVRDFLNQERDELYNLIKDPEETTNLIKQSEHKSIVDSLHLKIINHMRAIDDPVLNDI